MKCRLCGNSTILFTTIRDKQYFKCRQCQGIMLDISNYLGPKKEKERYEAHNNDVNNQGYQKFVSPMVSRVLEDYKLQHQGLDFGSGTGPVISKLLKDQGYNIKLYDPFFANYPERLKESYDYIVCCEVIEHFYHPGREFERLQSLLKPSGKLYLKTGVYHDEIDFEAWRYREDSTHVFFYQQETFEWILRHYGFSALEIDVENNIIILGGLL